MITRHLPTEAQMEELANANEKGLSVFYTQDRFGNKTYIKGFPVKILNVLGAGDAFASGFIYGLIQKWSIEKSIEMGNACGSYVVTKEGCANFMPTLDEALKIINK